MLFWPPRDKWGLSLISLRLLSLITIYIKEAPRTLIRPFLAVLPRIFESSYFLPKREKWSLSVISYHSLITEIPKNQLLWKFAQKCVFFLFFSFFCDIPNHSIPYHFNTPKIVEEKNWTISLLSDKLIMLISMSNFFGLITLYQNYQSPIFPQFLIFSCSLISSYQRNSYQRYQFS